MAVIFCITSSIAIDRFIHYIRITKFARFERIALSLFILLSVVSLVIPSTTIAFEVIDHGIVQEEIDAMSWLKFNTPHPSVVLGNVNEGNLIIALADRTNVWDTQFFHADDRIADVEILYTTESIIKAKKIIDTYQINYIYFSEKTKEFYGVDSLPYTSDENCFKEVYSNEFATIYQVVC